MPVVQITILGKQHVSVEETDGEGRGVVDTLTGDTRSGRRRVAIARNRILSVQISLLGTHSTCRISCRLNLSSSDSSPPPSAVNLPSSTLCRLSRHKSALQPTTTTAAAGSISLNSSTQSGRPSSVLGLVISKAKRNISRETNQKGDIEMQK